MTSPVEGVDRPSGSRGKKGISRHRSEGIFLVPLLEDLLVWSSSGLTGGQRCGLLRDVTCDALKQRVILAAVRWVDADSAIDKHEVLAKLLKGRTGCPPGVLSKIGSYAYSRVGLPDVVDAPPLRCCLRRQTYYRGASDTDAATTGGSRCHSGS